MADKSNIIVPWDFPSDSYEEEAVETAKTPQVSALLLDETEKLIRIQQDESYRSRIL